MTFWGAIFLGIEGVLIVMEVEYPFLKPAVAGLGIFLTAFGFRRALK